VRAVVVGSGAGDLQFIHVEMRGPGAAALSALAPSAGDEDAAHGFRGGTEEVRESSAETLEPVLPLSVRS
jgi:hypothetical protein